MAITQEKIQSLSSSVVFPHQAFIAGQFVSAKDGETFDCISPIDGRTLTQIPSCKSDDVDIAVRHARQAFNAGKWKKMPKSERKKILLKFVDLIEQHQYELAILDTLDMGKPIAGSLDDLTSSVRRGRWTVECLDKRYDQIAPTDAPDFAYITREPIGVVAIVLPWNYPVYLHLVSLLPALAVGNSVIVKPAEQSPLSALRLAEIALEAGLPEDVLQVVTGFGETVGQALGLHPDVDMVSFTGSVEVGKLFLQYSGQSNMKRLSLECGGKSPSVILADYPDLAKAAQSAAHGVFNNQGEICCAPTRLLLERKIADQFKEHLIEASKAYHPADPLNLNTKMGAMVDKTQMDQVLKYIDIGQQEGAKLSCGGAQCLQETGGYYIQPTLFEAPNNQLKIAQKEIFGPVITILEFDDLSEAITIANETTFGLAASVWTENLNHAHRLSREIRAGIVSVNTITSGNGMTTFGGFKQSGIGRNGSMSEFDNFMEKKTTWITLSS